MFKRMIQEKREYHAYKKRVNELPEEYRKAMKAIECDLWVSIGWMVLIIMISYIFGIKAYRRV